MTKLKVKNRYATVPNGLINDKRISFKSKGIYAYIQSKPDGWDFSIQRISFESKESIDAIRSGVHELEAVGYLERIKFQNEKGHWEIEYMLHETPIKEFATKEDPALENPTKENYTNNIKKEYNKKEIINKENNNIFLEKKINLDHIAGIGKMVNNENYRFADANNTIDNEGYRPKAEEKNYPPYSAAPPIKKEEKNENDFEAVFLADNCLDNINTLNECKEAKKEEKKALKTSDYNCPTDFEGLWSLYKVGSRDISSNVFRNLSLLEKEKIFKNVKEYVEKTPIEYRKNLQTYLKNKHYNDLIVDRTVSNKIAPKELPKKNINPEFEEIKKWHEEAQKRRETIK